MAGLSGFRPCARALAWWSSAMAALLSAITDAAMMNSERIFIARLLSTLQEVLFYLTRSPFLAWSASHIRLLTMQPLKHFESAIIRRADCDNSREVKIRTLCTKRAGADNGCHARVVR